MRKICSDYVMNKSVPHQFCNDHTAVNLMPDGEHNFTLNAPLFTLKKILRLSLVVNYFL